MSDTPKAGEVWLSHLSTEYVIVTAPDHRGYAHATTIENGETINCVIVNNGTMRRKPAAPPTDIECWTNYYPSSHGVNPVGWSKAEYADQFASDHRTWRFDAYGNWVPCQGTTVLGPAVKGRP